MVYACTGEAKFARTAQTATNGATVDGDTLVLTYNETLDGDSTPASSAFTVTVADAARNLASSNPMTVSGSRVTLTLASAVTPGQTVTLSYAVPETNPIKDPNGNNAAAQSDLAVINNTQKPTLRIANVSLNENAGSTNVTISDDDTRRVTVSKTELYVAESGSGTYTVVLDSRPTAAVTVTLSRKSGDADVTVSDALTFTADDWDTAKTVTVSAARDDDGDDDTAVIGHSVSGGDYASVTVTIMDDDTRGITVSETRLDVAEGDSETFTVVLDTRPSRETWGVRVTPSARWEARVSRLPWAARN